jgi:ketosteroid isomerase-like protein
MTTDTGALTTDSEALVRRAYHLAEGDVLDVQGFIDLFAEDGVFKGIGGVSGQESYRGEHLGDVVVWMGELLPDVHRELHRVNALGDVVAIELSIQGTFLGPFETPAGVIQPTGVKLDIPTADFWYVRDGKIQEFNCHIGMTTMFAQLGVLPDFESAVAASAPERMADGQGCAAQQPRTSGRVAPASDGVLSS